MKTLICSLIVLTSALSSAETIIKEGPNNYYVESTGTLEVKPAQSPVSDEPSPTSPAIPTTVEPVSNANQIPHLTTAAEQRASIENESQKTISTEQRAVIEKEIQRRQLEREELMKPKEGETLDQAIRRQEMAEGMLKKINKLSSMILMLPVQNP